MCQEREKAHLATAGQPQNKKPKNPSEDWPWVHLKPPEHLCHGISCASPPRCGLCPDLEHLPLKAKVAYQASTPAPVCPAQPCPARLSQTIRAGPRGHPAPESRPAALHAYNRFCWKVSLPTNPSSWTVPSQPLAHFCWSSLASVDPKKADICQEGLPVVNGDQVHNQSLAAVADRCPPLTQSAFQGKGTD